MANTLKFGNGEWYGKEDTILAYNDERNNIKPLPFTFERGSVATVVGKDGLIKTVGANEPRVDYKDNTDGAMLLEPQRSNLIVNSQKISLSPTKNGTFVDNFAISPDGTQNATKLTATDTDPFFYQSVSFSAGSYTASIYLKGIGNSIGKNFQIRLGVSGSAQIEIPSEWTRFEYTATMTSGSVNCGIEIPNPAVIGDEVLVWGWQIEQGSYPTSIINTSGSAVTRLQDECTNGGNEQVINSTEGVLYYETSAQDNSITTSVLSISSGSNANSLYSGFSSTSNTIQAQLIVGGVAQTNMSFVVSDRTDFNKIAILYQNNNHKMYVNGVEVAVDTNGSVPSANTFDRLNFDLGQGSFDFYGNIKEIKLYNTALTDQELINLTTI